MSSPAPPSVWARWKATTAYPHLWLAVYGLWLLFSAIAAFRMLSPIGSLAVRSTGFGLVAVLPPLLLWVSERTARWYEPGRR